jgi:hypothetical protein
MFQIFSAILKIKNTSSFCLQVFVSKFPFLATAVGKNKNKESTARYVQLFANQ